MLALTCNFCLHEIKRKDLKNENSCIYRVIVFGGICLRSRRRECSRYLFCEADFTEAWTDSLSWAEIQDRVDGQAPRLDWPLRDGTLAVAGWWQDLQPPGHYTGGRSGN